MTTQSPIDPYRGSGQLGGSLLETMIAMAIGLVIVAAAVEVFVMHHGHFTAQRTRADLQQDIRSGVNLMAGELRLASLLLTFSATEIAFEANVNDVQGRVLTSAFAGQSSVLATPNRGWVKGKTVRLCSPAGCEQMVLKRDGTSGHLAISAPLTGHHAVGSHVEVINHVRYYLSRSQSGNAKLMREVDHGSNPLIERVESFSLKYFNRSGELATRPDDVRLIRFQLQTSRINGKGGKIIRNHIQDLGVRAL
jgi:type II secretory pathway component PulJ